MTDNAFVESEERQALRKSVAAMAANTAAIVDGLSGGAVHCRPEA